MMSNLLINKNFLDQIPGFYGILNLNSQFEVVNKTGAQWTGFSSNDEMRGLSYADCRCRSAEDAELFLQHDDIVKQKGHIKFLGYYCYADGNWKTILGEKYLIRNENNQPSGIVSHFNDFSRSNIIDLGRFLINAKRKYINKKDNQFIYLLDEGSNSFANFTVRQTECLFFIIRGKKIKEIALILNLSPKTVEEHIDRIKHKTNCKTISQVIDKSIIEGYMNILPESLLNKLI